MRGQNRTKKTLFHNSMKRSLFLCVRRLLKSTILKKGKEAVFPKKQKEKGKGYFLCILQKKQQLVCWRYP